MTNEEAEYFLLEDYMAMMNITNIERRKDMFTGKLINGIIGLMVSEAHIKLQTI